MTNAQMQHAEIVGDYLGRAFNELWHLSIATPRSEAGPKDRERLTAVLTDIQRAETAMQTLLSE